jgi:hypothetical protein
MLNYKELQKRIEEKLSSYSKDELERWVEFDQQRIVALSKKSASMLQIEVSSVNTIKLTDPREFVTAHFYLPKHAKAA